MAITVTPTPVPTPVPAPTPTPPPGAYPGPAFTGMVLAGNLPIRNASVQLYAAGTTGSRIGAGRLLPAPILTGASGAFTIPAGYPCPIATTQVYVVATGGSAAPAAPANSAIALLVALGPCNRIGPQAVLNEATTAAAAWALAPFFGPAAAIGATPTNPTGIANAFLLAASLASPATGVTPGPAFPPNGVSPAARIGSLANLLNTCTAAAAPANPCAQLFNATSAPGATPPANTLDAAVALVQHPALNVAALYTLSRAGTAFSPTLPAAPADWTLTLTFSGGGLSSPSTLGVTSTGSLWVANYNNVASAFSPLGAPLFPTGITGFGLNDSFGLAVDARDNAWIANFDNSTVTELTTAGNALSGPTGYSGGALFFPLAVAIDPDSSVWFANYGRVSRLSASGLPLSGPTGYTSPQFNYPTAIAIDAGHNAWVANLEGTNVTRVSQDGRTIASAICCNGPTAVAIDQRGFAWLPNFYGNSVSQVAADLTVVSPGYTGVTLNRPQGVAIDGDGNVWVISYRGPGIAELAGSQTATPGAPLSPTRGWAPDTTLLGAFALAIDASGNLWITNSGNDTLTELVGLAAPVKTPTVGPAQAP